MDDEYWMRRALAYADLAELAGDVPVGCVIVHEGKEIGSGYNTRERDQDPIGHAEIKAIRQAAQTLGSWRLTDATAYVTLEPCIMCAGALVHARIRRLVYGCADAKSGAITSCYQVGSDGKLNHRFSISSGVLGDECSERLSHFFSQIREKKRNDNE